MMLLRLLIPAFVVLGVFNFTSKNKKQLRAIKVPVDKRKL